MSKMREVCRGAQILKTKKKIKEELSLEPSKTETRSRFFMKLLFHSPLFGQQLKPRQGHSSVVLGNELISFAREIACRPPAPGSPQQGEDLRGLEEVSHCVRALHVGF